MKISIITVCFNSDSTIRDTITSVLNQTYQNIEYLIIDGLSTDNTLGIIKEYNYGITKLISERDQGIYDAMNKGLQIATGDYILFLNSDDVFYNSESLEKLISFIGNHPADIVYSDLFLFDKFMNRPLRKWVSGPYSYKKIKKGWHPPHPGFCIKKEVVKEVPKFNHEFKIAADYDFMLTIFLSNKFSVKYSKIPLVKMRAGGASTSINGIITGWRELIVVLKTHKFSSLNIYLVLIYRYTQKVKQLLA